MYAKYTGVSTVETLLFFLNMLNYSNPKQICVVVAGKLRSKLYKIKASNCTLKWN